MKRPITYKKKEITIKDFTQIIPWESLEPIMGKRNTNAFRKWMSGQTCTSKGIFPCDLTAWLEHGKNYD